MTRVTLKVPLAALLPLVPSILHPEIRSSRYFAGRSDSLVIHSDETRKQSRNLELCFEKLHDTLVEAGKAAVPGETSLQQQKKVQKLWVAYGIFLLEILTLFMKARQSE
ncbi:hypothetical protein LOZ66_002402 [Ophidiomyces ophidiicola]|nr:hypothetical protein LOZ66_002402 [Ophidiomyces ophidiicola]